MLLSVVVGAQVTATLTLDNGSEITTGVGGIAVDGIARLEVWETTPGWYRVVARCTGEPAWRTNSWARPPFLSIRSITAEVVPGLEPKYWTWRGCRPTSGGWVLIDHSMRRDVHDRMRDTGNTQVLEAGTAIAWTIGPPGAPYPPPRRPEYGDRLRAVRGMSPGKAPAGLPTLAYERLSHLRSLQTASVQSLDLGSPRHDLGWLLLHWHDRFTGGRAPGAYGPWAWGSLLGADGHRSWSYDGILAALDWYLRSGDPWAWELACIGTDWKLHQALYRGPPGHRASGRWTYEKGANSFIDGVAHGRPTDYRFPEASHEWDAGAIAVALMSGDSEWLDCAEVRRVGLLATSIPNVRNFGARLRGWYLWNLRHWHGLTGDAAFLDRARAVCTGTWSTVRPGETWFSNDAAAPGTTVVDPWQQALLLGEMSRWEALGLELDPRFNTFARATVEQGTWIVDTAYGPALAGGYTLDLKTGARTAPWPHTAGFFLPLLARFNETERHAAAITSALSMAFAAGAWDLPVALPARELQMDYSRGGGHGAKSLHQTLAVVEDRDLILGGVDR